MESSSHYHDDPEDSHVRLSSLNKFTRVFIFIFLIVTAGSFLKTTLAANITINSSNAIEFGQGILATTACDNNILVTPYASFSNSTNTFKLSGFKISNLDTSVNGCVDEALTLNFYSDTSSASLGSYAVVYTAGAFASNAGTLTSSGGGTTSSTVTLTLSSASIPSGNVSKFTVQSSASTCATGGVCQVGDTGPGGGIIFYKAVSPFICGPTRAASCTYLEAAPASWSGNANGDTGTSVAWSGNTTQSVGSAGGDTATATAIGWGYRNTLAAVAQDSTPTKAITLARAYNGGGLSDWFLPTKDELNQLYLQKNVVGGFKSSSYWTSSEVSATNIYMQDFSNGGSWSNGKSGGDGIRPVRAF